MKRIIAVGVCVMALALVGGCKKRTAQEVGKEAVEEKAGLVKGIGDGLSSKGKEAAESLGEGVTRSVKGLGQGVENALAMEIRLGSTLSQAGVKVTRAQKLDKRDGGTTNHGVSVYMICAQGLKSRLVLKAFDKQDQEIGRSATSIALEADQATYVDFVLDERVPLLSARYFTIEKSDGASPTTQPQAVR